MMAFKPLPAGMTMKNPAALIATGFGSGRMHPAPGTWGTLAAWVLGFVMTKHALAIAFIVAMLAGLWAVRRFEAESASHDNGMIVIDEWAGMWLAMMFASFWDQAVLAFVLFRFFDIWKPWPIRWMDKNIAGAWGVMVDDVAAGLAAGVLVYGYGLWIASS
jgi:phosphatidylglycerophosphatase A